MKNTPPKLVRKGWRSAGRARQREALIRDRRGGSEAASLKLLRREPPRLAHFVRSASPPNLGGEFQHQYA